MYPIKNNFSIIFYFLNNLYLNSYIIKYISIPILNIFSKIYYIKKYIILNIYYINEFLLLLQLPTELWKKK